MTEAMYDLMYIIDIVCRCIMFLSITIAVWVWLWRGRRYWKKK